VGVNAADSHSPTEMKTTVNTSQTRPYLSCKDLAVFKVELIIRAKLLPVAYHSLNILYFKYYVTYTY